MGVPCWKPYSDISSLWRFGNEVIAREKVKITKKTRVPVGIGVQKVPSEKRKTSFSGQSLATLELIGLYTEQRGLSRGAGVADSRCTMQASRQRLSDSWKHSDVATIYFLNSAHSFWRAAPFGNRMGEVKGGAWSSFERFTQLEFSSPMVSSDNIRRCASHAGE